MKIEQYVKEYLGRKVQDRVTEFKGVISSISFDLYGCIQGAVTPTELDNYGKLRNGQWMDLNRLKILSKKPVMDIPNFELGYQAEAKQGAADKPSK